jgi:apolipoprotein N-acyltransferase
MAQAERSESFYRKAVRFSFAQCLTQHRSRADVLSFVSGALTVAAFAPYGVAPLAVLGPGLLFLAWVAAGSGRRAFARGYLYGLGLFGFGVSWIYNSLSLFGQAIAPYAALLTALFVMLLALLPALMGWIAWHMRPLPRDARLLLAWPALWVLFEWLRSTLFTGFPWLLLGDSQVGFAPGGLAPLAGTLGVSWLLALLGGLLTLVLSEPRLTRRLAALLLIPVIWAGVGSLRAIHWTQPDGAPLRVSLIQGNVAQRLKFNPQSLNEILRRYRDMTRAHWDSRLIVWPETAVPQLYRTVAPNYLDPLAAEAKQHGDDIVLGVFRQRADKFYNAVVSIGSAPPEFYLKHHLVPFGEYLPLQGLLGWLYRSFNVPMSNLSPGHGGYLIHAAGIPIGVSICYEVAYGAEVIRALPQAKLLINVSNDAWFGDSLEPAQQLQMARMRALETGRYMLASTNSGLSGVVAPDGRILALGDRNKTVAVSADVQAMSGATPYVRWGNSPVVGLALLVFLGAGLFAFGRQSSKRKGESV